MDIFPLPVWWPAYLSSHFPVSSVCRERSTTAIRASYLENSLTTRIHGNIKRLHHNVTSYEAMHKIVTLITNITEEQATMLPRWIPVYKKDDFKLLTSSTTKKCTISIQVQNA